MDRHQAVVDTLAGGLTHTMKVTGGSMRPLIESGSLLTFMDTGDYAVGDVVYTKVKGRVIPAHKITKIGADGRYMISNNRGHDNGWTRRIFGRVVSVNGEPFGRPLAVDQQQDKSHEDPT